MPRPHPTGAATEAPPARPAGAGRTDRPSPEIPEVSLVDPQAVLFSVFTPEGRENPFPALETLREIAPVYYEKELDTFFLTTYADCQAVLTDPTFKTPDLTWCEDHLPDWREHPAADFFYSSMLRANQPDHTRLRRLVSGGFTARRVAALESAIEKITDSLLNDLADATCDGGSANFQNLVGYPLPVAVVGELIGVPEADRPQFWQLGRDASRLLEPVRSEEDWALADRAVTQLREYFRELAARRQRVPADDLVTTLIKAKEGDERLTEDEVIDTLALVFVAGFETTTSLLGLTTHALLTHPDQLALIKQDPDLVPQAVEESLRWDTPVQMTERIAGRKTEIGGVTVPEGANVTTVMAAANRDPRQHPDPHRFDVRRTGTKVLSFSAGPHYCLGAALARLEGSVAVRRLFERFPDLALAGTPQRRESFSLRAYENLPVTTSGKAGK
ncbi:cytochrome P450 [Streptomyces sp. MST-110588]|uniref:cytochrome P450 n=1 Tax=Streptomyces sp. MST-110588 TaxID=2833628 RepID=UPI001F5D1262|nr:cytochrome P450 [Streptomyces sp. MST-110588]UNO38553.1 cytochrome P450 [Streptomyces sp. MST-110588]